MSTYTVNIIHKKWYSLQSYMHINPKTKVTDIVIVISIIVAVKCHTHPEHTAAVIPTFPKLHKSHTEPAAASIQMQASQREVAQATESDQQLASQKNSKAIPATNGVKSYLQLLYTRFSSSTAHPRQTPALIRTNAVTEISEFPVPLRQRELPPPKAAPRSKRHLPEHANHMMQKRYKHRYRCHIQMNFNK